jgi:replicative DNA helicase
MSDQLQPNDTFGPMGRTYQEKVIQAVIQDPTFAEQVIDVLDPKFFDLKYLEEIAKLVFRHRQDFKTFPSPDLIEIMVQKELDNDLVAQQCKEFLKRMKENPLGGDIAYIESTSLDFARRQTLKEAMVVAIDKIEQNDYESISTIIKDALNKGATRDLGHEYMDETGFAKRSKASIRKPIPTGWAIIDKELNGGWERGILVTFIAPTGAGKSMFLVNCGAAAVAQGLSVLYVTCEMADYKIGLRFDSYYSGIAINDVPNQQEEVQKQVKDKAKGGLFIKEFPTKTATVQTIRAYLQRLVATKGFIPDMVIIDYADLLRSSRGFEQKRFELEGVYEELRALAQEFQVVLITADQTNRSGLEMEVVTVAQIGEAYSKATVCDVIMTISRRMEDKQSNCGRLFIAKSRLGRDGVVYPFTLNTATVKVSVLNQGEDPLAVFMEHNENLKKKTAERAQKLGFGKINGGGGDKPTN